MICHVILRWGVLHLFLYNSGGDGQLKRGAIVLFGKDPGKFCTNFFVKIGRFGTDDADLVFQETEEGNLLNLSQAVLEQLLRKFLIRKVSFEGLHRRETPEYPITALREVILNALVHRNYAEAPTQIRVYDHKITFWNDGRLSEELALEALKKPHSSKPRNPVIADVCFKGNLIDSWERGIIKVIDTCKEAELPEPELAERDGGFLVTFFGKNVGVNVGVKSAQVQDKFRKEVLETLKLIERNLEDTTEQIAEIANKAKRTIERHNARLKDAGINLFRAIKLNRQAGEVLFDQFDIRFEEVVHVGAVIELFGAVFSACSEVFCYFFGLELIKILPAFYDLGADGFLAG
ncbi:MAG: hypothetical protein KF870_13590 [Leadbetterella sp.]|nr:hypothetical protein [Leadbetterella sp.]